MVHKDLEQFEWLSVYVFHYDLDDIILKGIAPFLNQDENHSRIKGFFFIRYGEGGPHIRFRVLVESRHQDLVKTKIAEHFVSFLLTKGVSEREAKNFVVFVTYIPEMERYGGGEAIKVAEHHFEMSSRTVIGLMNVDGFEKKKIGYALMLHLLFCKSCKMSFKQVIQFFNFICFQWATYPTINDTDVILKNYQQRYSELKPTISPLTSKILANFFDVDNKENLKDSLLDAWLKHVFNLNAYFENLHLNGRLKVKNGDGSENYKVAIYSSFVHMTNNRLGLVNWDEGYLAYLIKSSVSDYCDANNMPL